jgi:hypothetical protein
VRHCGGTIARTSSSRLPIGACSMTSGPSDRTIHSSSARVCKIHRTEHRPTRRFTVRPGQSQRPSHPWQRRLRCQTPRRGMASKNRSGSADHKPNLRSCGPARKPDQKPFQRDVRLGRGHSVRGPRWWTQAPFLRLRRPPIQRHRTSCILIRYLFHYQSRLDTGISATEVSIRPTRFS